ncbi:hypothetical protein ACM66B_006300 [Microbotryomycetes sp. NB124-2]
MSAFDYMVYFSTQEVESDTARQAADALLSRDPVDDRRRRLSPPSESATTGATASTSMTTRFSLPPPQSDDEERALKRHEPAETLGAAAATGSAQSAPTTKLPASGSVLPAPRRRKGQRLGRLEAVLQEMPIEILGEILSHLTPNMLLRLARMAKVFRRLLMTRSARSIWRRSFANDGITGLTNPDMCEPKLASLIWDKECEACGRLKVHKICYGLWSRLCDPCMKLRLKTPGQLRMDIPFLVPEVLDCVPFITTPPCRGGQWNQFEGTPFKLFAEQAILDENDKLLELSNEPGPEDGPSDRARYVEERKRVLELLQKDAATLQTWQTGVDSNRVGNKVQLRKERVESIRRKCLDQGFEEQDIERAFDKDSAVHTEVDQPYALTDRVWRKISKPIFAELSRIRDSRLGEQKKHANAEMLDRIKNDHDRQIAFHRQLNNLNRVVASGSGSNLNADVGNLALQQRQQAHQQRMPMNQEQRLFAREAGHLQGPRNIAPVWRYAAPSSQAMPVSAPPSQVLTMPASSTLTPTGNLDVLSTISVMLRDGRPIRFPHPAASAIQQTTHAFGPGLSAMADMSFARLAQATGAPVPPRSSVPPSVQQHQQQLGVSVGRGAGPMASTQQQHNPVATPASARHVMGWSWPVQQHQQNPTSG